MTAGGEYLILTVGGKGNLCFLGFYVRSRQYGTCGNAAEVGFYSPENCLRSFSAAGDKEDGRKDRMKGYYSHSYRVIAR